MSRLHYEHTNVYVSQCIVFIVYVWFENSRKSYIKTILSLYELKLISLKTGVCYYNVHTYMCFICTDFYHQRKTLLQDYILELYTTWRVMFVAKYLVFSVVKKRLYFRKQYHAMVNYVLPGVFYPLSLSLWVTRWNIPSNYEANASEFLWTNKELPLH